MKPEWPLLISPIDELLAEQQRLTAVESFSRRHDRDELPIQAKSYRDLLPLTAPRAGEQYAFEVDLDACTGCKACVTACHALNGLDEHETWREVGLLVGGPDRMPFQQTVTTACHHCVDPGCLSGCPVEAYEKDLATGIVRHFDDQCIGCQYCLWTCPYEVPKYSKSRGIVRKCDMCHSRLTGGEAPACVQACPNEAIRITVVEQQSVRDEFRKSQPEKAHCQSGVEQLLLTSAPHNAFLPDSPVPSLTLPTTRYRTSRPQPANMRAADHFKIKPQPVPWSLIFMLLLTQLAVGIFASEFLVRRLWPEALTTNGKRWLPVAACGVAATGLVASIFHLGRPWQAWRSFLGWRTSWLSREMIFFGCFISSAIAWAGWNSFHPDSRAAISFGLSAVTVVSGLSGVFCSAMLYVSTRREFWRMSHTGGRFFGTAAVLGPAAFLMAGTLFPFPGSLLTAVALALMLAAAIKLSVEARFLRHVTVDLNDSSLTQLQRSVWLLQGPLGALSRGRQMCAFMGGIILPLFWLIGASSPAIPVSAFVICLLAELIERHLFFAAMAPAKMPGAS